jgi:hypothetical protein
LISSCFKPVCLSLSFSNPIAVVSNADGTIQEGKKYYILVLLFLPLLCF